MTVDECIDVADNIPMLASPQHEYLEPRVAIVYICPPKTLLDAFEIIPNTSYDNYAAVVAPCALNGF